MIMFIGVVEALARVVAEVVKARPAPCFLSEAIEREVELMKMPLFVVSLTAIGFVTLSPASRAAPLGGGGFHSGGGVESGFAGHSSGRAFSIRRTLSNGPSCFQRIRIRSRTPPDGPKNGSPGSVARRARPIARVPSQFGSAAYGCPI
jgi:hypothetical protein